MSGLIQRTFVFDTRLPIAILNEVVATFPVSIDITEVDEAFDIKQGKQT